MLTQWQRPFRKLSCGKDLYRRAGNAGGVVGIIDNFDLMMDDVFAIVRQKVCAYIIKYSLSTKHIHDNAREDARKALNGTRVDDSVRELDDDSLDESDPDFLEDSVYGGVIDKLYMFIVGVRYKFLLEVELPDW